MPPALEVLVELAPNAVERRPEHPNAEDAGKRLVLSFDGVRDAGEAAVGRREEEIADRRGDDVEANVDKPLADRRLAEERVELGRDRHVPSFSLRSLRTPDDAAARAASSDEPSAVPISAYGRS